MAFCANCGSQVEGRFCQKCGAPVGGAAPMGGGAAMGGAPMGAGAPAGGATAPGIAPQAAGMSDNVAGALCYLFGFITGILFLVLAPYNQNRDIKFHAFQSIFLNIAWFVIWIGITIVSIVIGHIPILGAIVTLLLGFCVWIGALVIWLYMMFKTYNGARVVLPIIGPMAEKQAGM